MYTDPFQICTLEVLPFNLDLSFINGAVALLLGWENTKDVCAPIMILYKFEPHERHEGLQVLLPPEDYFGPLCF